LLGLHHYFSRSVDVRIPNPRQDRHPTARWHRGSGARGRTTPHPVPTRGTVDNAGWGGVLAVESDRFRGTICAAQAAGVCHDKDIVARPHSTASIAARFMNARISRNEVKIMSKLTMRPTMTSRTGATYQSEGSTTQMYEILGM